MEEMPPFPERESSLLAKLKKKKPTTPGAAEEKKKGIELNSVGESSTDSIEVCLQFRAVQICIFCLYSLLDDEQNTC